MREPIELTEREHETITIALKNHEEKLRESGVGDEFLKDIKDLRMRVFMLALKTVEEKGEVVGFDRS